MDDTIDKLPSAVLGFMKQAQQLNTLTTGEMKLAFVVNQVSRVYPAHKELVSSMVGTFLELSRDPNVRAGLEKGGKKCCKLMGL